MKGWLREMKPRNRYMVKVGSSLVLAMACALSSQIAVGGEPRYPIFDSKFPAAEAKLGWLDNERVIFHGYEVGKVGQPSPDDGHPMAETGLFIWDTGKNTVTKYWDIDGPVPLCVFRGQVFFSKKLKEKENTWLLISGTLGKEEQRTVYDSVSVNGHSCRVSDRRPSWMKEDKHRRLPLLEEHGYLDFGIPIWVDSSRKATPIVLYPPDNKKSVELPLTSQQVQLYATYAAFADVYLLKGEQRTSDAVSVWQFSPDGTVTRLLEPKGRAWERIGWGDVHLTKKGLFLVGGQAGYDTAGTSGAYLLIDTHLQRLIAGLVWNEAVSPDGCKVAFVHVPHSQAGADSARELRAGKPGARTLKVINLCKGD